ncbi:tether containing UBX domain for GLUT4 isoform X2 [Hyperolius riggenbachi]|uniref:tether containing UBX domain for GLUT4 isoform X2 n=1 Tax=Hyperolius riggenbachi TaxID=752182 RepID=UPI0035A2D0E6
MAASGAGVTVLAPNGRRQTVKVTAGTPLLQVLEEVCKKQNFNPREYNLKACLDEVPPGSVAVCIYMRDEVIGETSLKQTTLQSLGLTCGSAIVRFVVRKCDTPQSRPPSTVREGAERHLDINPKTESRGPSTEEVKSVVSQEARTSLDTTKGESTVKAASLELTAKDNLPTESASVEAIKREVSIEVPSSETTKQEPSEATNREPSKVTKIESSPEAAPTEWTSSVQRVQPSMDSVRPKSSSSQLAQPPSVPQATAFIPFQGGGHRLGGANVPGTSFEADFQCATGHEPFQSPEHSKPKKSKTDQEDDWSKPIDRETAVCHMDLDQNIYANTQELPDDFFEITVDDVRRRFAELRKERQRLEEAPLITKALRETQMKEKMERYPKVVLRVLFPDRYMLQGFFRVTETLGSVKEFVRSHLAEPETPFYLFITPPRTELKDESQNLFEAQLFPAAVIHFGSQQNRDHYLQQKLLSDPMAPSQADALVARAMPRAPAPSTSTPPAVEPLAEVPRRAPDNYEEEAGISDSHQQVQRDHGKVPKWLKLPGKK